MLNIELLLWAIGALMVAILQYLKEGIRESWFLFLGSAVFAFFYIRRMVKKYLNKQKNV